MKEEAEVVMNTIFYIHREQGLFESGLWEIAEYFSFLKRFAERRNLPIDITKDIERTQILIRQLIDVSEQMTIEVLQAYEDSFKGGGQNRGDL